MAAWLLLLWFKWEAEGQKETRMNAKVMKKEGYGAVMRLGVGLAEEVSAAQ